MPTALAVATSRRLLGAGLLPVLLALGGCAADSGRPAAPGAASPTRGASLYARHCAACHGERGDADTGIAGLMQPRPRAFADGMFRLASTQNGVPSSEDLVRSIRRGMPGSAMPGYEWLPATDLEALAAHVRELATDGVAARLQAADKLVGGHATAAELRERAAERLRPGQPVIVPPSLPADEATLQLGRSLWQQHCAACHGADGRGRPRTPGWAGGDEFAWARDFTAGFLRAEPTTAELAFRIRAGMPGAHMPPTPLSDAETAALIAFVQSMIPDGAGKQHVQWRHHLRVPHAAKLPARGDDPAWQAIEAVRLPVAPLRWRQDAVFEVFVRVAHDGQRLALQVDWRDDTCDDRAGKAPQGDGLALEFTRAADPPFFAMGGSEAVNLWHWKAFRSEELAGALDLLTSPGHTSSDVPAGIPGLTGPVRLGEAVAVHGPGEMAQRRGTGLKVPVEPRWHDGHWTVTMTRDLAARSDDEIPLRPGDSVLVAFAVWDGSVDEHAGSKSVSTWHRLELLP